MLLSSGETLKRLVWFGVFAVFTVLAYFLEQRGVWSALQLLLGLGAVLAFYLGWGKGVVFNLPKAVAFSLLAVILSYFLLDLAFPGTFAHRLGDLAGAPYTVGVVVALLLFRPARNWGQEGSRRDANLTSRP